MTFGSYLTFLAAVAVGLIGIDWWQLHTGRTVHYRFVPHRKLRASCIAARIGDSAGRADRGVEPQPAPTNLAVPGAGPIRRATTAPTTPSGAPRPHVGGGPASTSVAVGPPDPAATGSQPQPRDDRPESGVGLGGAAASERAGAAARSVA